MKKTILIVDDMMLNIDMLTSILGDYYAIMAAISGEKAIKLLNRRVPDLVLLDVSMPGIDGFEVLSFIKSKPELLNIPVIFVTGEHDEHSEEKGLMMGAVDYIRKPYNAAVVSVKVRNHLELKDYRDNLELMVKSRTKQLEERTKQLAASREALIMGMSLMSESHDKVTGDHIRRIKHYTSILAIKLLEVYPHLITHDLAEQIILFSPLHDVGKISISDTILKKAGFLTHEEYDIMKNHTVEGAELLRKIGSFLVGDDNDGNNFNVAIEIAQSHHERFDGTGYPYALKGGEIPLSAKLVALADVYDALRSPRPYKSALSHTETKNIILSGDGRTSPSHFDPIVLEIFEVVHPQFEQFAQ